MKVIIAHIILLFTPITLMAQTITWQRTYGSYEFDEQGYAICQTSDGGYIFGGVRAVLGSYVIRINPKGDTLWSNIVIGGLPTQVSQLSDGNFLVVGYTAGDGYAVKMNDNGNIIWFRLYGGVLTDQFRGSYEFPDGTLLFAGNTTINLNPARVEYFIIKTTSAGDTLWRKSFDSTGFLSALEPVPGVGFLLSGTVALLIDTNGAIIRSSSSLTGKGVYSEDLDGFLFNHRKDSIRIGISLVRTDLTFAKVWDRFIHCDHTNLFANSVISEGPNFVVSGQSLTSASESGILCLKINSFGNVLWQREYFRNEYYFSGANQIAKCMDRGFVMIGQSKPFFGQLDITITKTDSNGLFFPTVILDIAGLEGRALALSQNYPNPFNPVTTITYDLPNSGFVTLKVYDMLGREVKTLVNEMKTAGFHKAQFTAEDLASGAYFYRLSVSGDAGEFVAVRKCVILK